MRTALAMLVFVLVVSVTVHARQATSLDRKLTDTLNRMEGKDAGTRETAFDDLAELWVEGKMWLCTLTLQLSKAIEMC
jgi:hypothetical protein